MQMIIRGASMAVLFGAVSLLSGCIGGGPASVAEGKEQFLTIYCQVEYARSDAAEYLEAPEEEYWAAIDLLAQRLEEASYHLNDPSLEWPASVRTDDLSQMAHEFKLNAQALKQGEAPQVLTETKLAHQRIRKALEIGDAEDECLVRR